MVQKLIANFFDIRKGEFKISLFMFLYIFITIAVLLIVKPTINSLFLSELGAEQLPFGFMLVALAAIISSFVYARLSVKYQLKKIIQLTLSFSIVVFIILGTLLIMGHMGTWMLYFFYTWVAIYAVLSASQFWVLANLVFNVRDAKRLFGFIGSGAILGGIFGGYLTSILAPLVGNDFLIFLAAFLLVALIPLLGKIWGLRVTELNKFKQQKRTAGFGDNSLKLIQKSRHLTLIACIVAVGVLVAKLVDYMFSEFASNAIEDPEELTAFFGFWFSTFNLLSLMVQLFFTHRIVGIWGVGFSLLLLPLGILFGSIFFLFVPELSAIVAIKAMDGVLKQSVNKSASELLALPLPFELKNKTKSFIDVVVDSLATGCAGLLLIFFVKGMDLGSSYIIGLIIFMVLLWILLISEVRKEYYLTFKNNLESKSKIKKQKRVVKGQKASVVEGMRKVFRSGTEKQILFMLNKLMEINDKRFLNDVRALLDHPLLAVKTAAINNLFFLGRDSVPVQLPKLIELGDPQLTQAVLEYQLMHSGHASKQFFEKYLLDPNELIANTALFCLAKEVRENPTLMTEFQIHGKLAERLSNYEQTQVPPVLLKTIGVAGFDGFYKNIHLAFEVEENVSKLAAIEAAGLSMAPQFLDKLLDLLPEKKYQSQTIVALLMYGPALLPILVEKIHRRQLPLKTCRLIPKVFVAFGTQQAVKQLFLLLNDVDLSIRLEVVRALSQIRDEQPQVRFNRFKVVAKIYDECRLYHQTLSAMHSQIILSFRNRRKGTHAIGIAEKDARASLLELLERRLDAGLERIFKLLGLKYPQKDVQIAYEGLLSPREEARTNALDFLDNLLTGNLKQVLLPIIEEAALDVTSEEAVQKLKHNVPSELECFEYLLQTHDLKLRLAVLYLIGKQADSKYLPLLEKFVNEEDIKLRTFALEAKQEIEKATPF